MFVCASLYRRIRYLSVCVCFVLELDNISIYRQYRNIDLCNNSINNNLHYSIISHRAASMCIVQVPIP